MPAIRLLAGAFFVLAAWAQTAPDFERDVQPLFTHREKMQLQYSVRNTHRAVGTRLAAMITRKYGMDKLQPAARIRARHRRSPGAVHGRWDMDRGFTGLMLPLQHQLQSPDGRSRRHVTYSWHVCLRWPSYSSGWNRA